ncbi:hypothetical protein CTEN210_06258 [Chaetoceros tenuissimus]|uniref:dihydropyrimidinase n=1 Tax=Chaetoceros tenuissimus TaxID=426638 RepID=A0AAD3CPI4_9STRA|nr:hypothetical protein CTEN210_06258 [Chaetoceros tenuissimus]
MPGESNQNMNQPNRNDRCPCCIPWRSAVPRRPNTNTSSTSHSAPSIDFGNFYVLRNANVWTLEENTNSSSVLDIWVSNGKIASMTPPSAARSMCPSIPGLKEIEMRGLDIVPGFVDIHVHAIGGGGEDSFGSRTPEACLEELVEAGVTTFVGILGTDTVGRNMESLIAKTRALSEKGLTGRVWLGGYAFPIENTVTGSVRKDLTMLPDVIGVGELAISDHRSSFPTTDDLLKLCSEVRVAGMVSGNAGVTYFHMGDNDTALQPLVDVVKRNPVLQTYLVPTHMERTPTLIQQGKAWMQAGGFVDFSCWPERQRVAIRQYLEDGEDGEALIREKLSISSDSYGSISVFDDNGTIVDSTYGKPKTLLETFMALVYKDGVSIDTALRLFCRNPAKVIRMDKMPINKGKISVGSDADFLVLKLPENPLPLNYPYKAAHGMSWPNADGVLQYVIASGKVMKCPRNTSARGQVMASQSQISQSMRSTTQTRVSENRRSTLPPLVQQTARVVINREQAKKQASSTSRRPVVVAQIADGKDSLNGPQIAQVSQGVVNREQVNRQKETSGTLQRPVVVQGQQQGSGTSERPEVMAPTNGKNTSNNGPQVAQARKAVANREKVQMQKQANSTTPRPVVPEQIENRNDTSNGPKLFQTTIPIPQEQAHVLIQQVRINNVSVAQDKTTANLEIPPDLPGLGPISPELTKKRGRGRPRKDASITTTSTSKSVSTANKQGDQQPQPAKKRGRPRKDASLPPQSIKKRGRPRKDPSVDRGSKDVVNTNGESGQQQQPAEKRGRGRPRKDPSVDRGSKDVVNTNEGEGQPEQPVKKRGRGRPRKDTSVDSGSKDVVNTNEGEEPEEQPVKKRGRGRPRKDASVDSGSKDVVPTNEGEGPPVQPAEKRGRGRPRKDASVDVDSGSKDVVPTSGGAGQQEQQAKKRGRGRPRKDASDDSGSNDVVPTNGESGQQQQPAEKRGRGRHRKNASPKENSLPMLSKNGETEQQSQQDTSINVVADSSTPSNGDELQPPRPTTDSLVTTEQNSLTNSKGNREKTPQAEKKDGRVRSGKKSPLIYLF